MRHVNGKFFARVIANLAALLLLAALPFPAAAQRSRASAKKKPVYYTVKAGHVLRVRLNDELDSEKARVGDRFTVTTVDPAVQPALHVP